MGAIADAVMKKLKVVINMMTLIKTASKMKGLYKSRAERGVIGPPKTLKLYFTDAKRPIYVKITPGGIDFKYKSLKFDSQANMSTDCFLNIIDGQHRRMDTGTGEMKLYPYTEVEAVANGHATLTGEGVTADFEMLVQEIKPYKKEMRKMLAGIRS